MPWDTLGGGQFQPPPLLMMLNSLYVMTMTMNRQMLRHAVKLSTPHLFFDNSNTAVSSAVRLKVRNKLETACLEEVAVVESGLYQTTV
jgi:hypothetical protein